MIQYRPKRRFMDGIISKSADDSISVDRSGY